MDAYRWRCEILTAAMNKIALSGNELAKEAMAKVASRRMTFTDREKQLLEFLNGKPRELVDIMENMQLTRFNIEKVISRLRFDKKVYLHSFSSSPTNTGAQRKVWAVGNKPDAVFVSKKKADKTSIKKPVKLSIVTVVERRSVKRDPMVSAFFGLNNVAS